MVGSKKPWKAWLYLSPAIVLLLIFTAKKQIKCLYKPFKYEQKFDLSNSIYPAPLVRLTPGTVNDIDALYSQLVNFNSQGYSEEVEESTEYIRCFGAPIIKKGETVGAISVAIPTFRYKEEDRNLYIEGLKKTALAIARLWE